MKDKELRIGVGKIASLGDRPWYVTLYTRDLSVDKAQGWFPTLPEASAFAHHLLARCKAIEVPVRP